MWAVRRRYVISMLISSPHTKKFKTLFPPMIFGIGTAVLVWNEWGTLFTNIWTNLFVLLVVYACGAWALWRPFRLMVADVVEDRAGQLYIRRGEREASLPYSSIQSLDYLKVGSIPGVKLTFKEPNAFGTAIGFYLNQNMDKSAVPQNDPIEYLQRQFEKSRSDRAA
jgi:hypothetical protein